jgi:hypothetical protein
MDTDGHRNPALMAITIMVTGLSMAMQVESFMLLDLAGQCKLLSCPPMVSRPARQALDPRRIVVFRHIEALK